MRNDVDTGGIVVPFRHGRGQGGFQQGRDQRGFMDAVYAAGSMPVAADDRDTKLVASRLQVYGFIVIDQVETDGSLRRLRPSEAIRALRDRPWRVSKSSLDGSRNVTIPVADQFLFEAPLSA